MSKGDPVVGGAAVTPSDSTEIPSTRGVWVGTGGDVSVMFHNGDGPVTIANVRDGQLLPFRVTQVRATNTTATDIVAVY
jgi:hypothetical protein